MSVATIGWTRPQATSGGFRVPEGSDIPRMRPRTKGKAAGNIALAELLSTALEELADSTCCFWACEGPSRPRAMCTCRKCWAMRNVGTVMASLLAREGVSP